MSVHSQIKNNGPRHIRDILKDAGLTEAQVREARSTRKQAILDNFRDGHITRHEAEDTIFAERLGDA